MNLSNHLPLFVDLMLKSTVVLALAWLAARRWRHASAANRHMIWLAAFGVLLVLPLIGTLNPRGAGRSANTGAMFVFKVPAVQPMIAEAAGQASPVAERALPVKRAGPVLTWRDGVVLVWLGGVVALVMLRGAGAARLRLLHRGSRVVRDGRIAELCRRIVGDFQIGRPVELRVSDECRMAMTWGTWRPVVMLPAEAQAWADERLALVMRHELAHVRRGDCLARFFCQAAGVFYWPNPLVWLAARRARLAQEQACDDRVLAAGADAEAYAMELVAAVRDMNSHRWFAGAVAMAEPSTLESRVLGIVGEGGDRTTLRGSTTAAAMVCAVVALVGCSHVMVRDEPKEVPTKSVSVEIRTHFFEVRSADPEIKAAMDSFLKGAKRRGSDTATVAGILTERQAAAAIKTLAGIQHTDLLSAPMVITVPGKSAKIVIGQEFRYPTHWEKDPAGRDWKPTAFETRNLGVEMEVTPQVNADGSIDLELNPKTTEFQGFVEQQGLSGAGSKTDSGAAQADNAEAPSPKVQTPVFETRAVQAAIAGLAPGETVVLRCGTRMESVRATTINFLGKVTEDQITGIPMSFLVFVSASKMAPNDGATATTR